MKTDIISYADLTDNSNTKVKALLLNALLKKGIVGIKGVPDFEKKSAEYVDAAREFSALDESIKRHYTPARDDGKTEGYELGAERFQTKEGEWQVDSYKASYYAYVPDQALNQWPTEVDLKTPYLALGELIFQVGKIILDKIDLNEQIGLSHSGLVGYGRMLHYQKESDLTNQNPDWCGAHFDHGLFTGLMPAYYFCNGEAVTEPQEAGLFIRPTDSEQFEKIDAADKSVLLFQVGEFGQLISDDNIKATQHKVQKAKGGIERFAFALFYSPSYETIINSKSILKEDERYKSNQKPDGSITAEEWNISSYARYRVTS